MQLLTGKTETVFQLPEHRFHMLRGQWRNGCCELLLQQTLKQDAANNNS